MAEEFTSNTQPTPPSAQAPIKPKFNFNDFINFRTMVTPSVIKWYYIIGSALIVLVYFIMAVLMMLGGGLMVLVGFAYLFLGIPISLVVFRLVCEFIAVIFSIHKELKRLK
jgi:hypothetical protein